MRNVVTSASKVFISSIAIVVFLLFGSYAALQQTALHRISPIR